MQDSSKITDDQTAELPQRLCGEIQLFDLCDLDSCHFRNGRFCTDPMMLESFEKISEAELRVPELSRLDEEDGEADESGGFDGYDEERDDVVDDSDEDYE
ncbi:MAG: hypothetical protein PHI31_00030 [Desulfuromonadaceae bacterium]|nr:hypothetical protein [Desulfuromonadaceae bacterium]